MNKKKTSPGMAQLLTEEFWATTREMQDRILQDCTERLEQCYPCKHVTITDRRPCDGAPLQITCKRQLPSTAHCPQFEENKEQIIIYCDRAIDPKE